MTPKEELAALMAAAELLKEAALTFEQKRQAKDARRLVERDFHGPPNTNPLAALVDGMHMQGRKRRIKKRMIQHGY